MFGKIKLYTYEISVIGVETTFCPGGGGKSTFLKLILGFLSPSSGRINFEDKNINYLGYVPQNIPINPAFPISALEVVMMGNIKKHSFGFWKKSDKNTKYMEIGRAHV